jgi:hypothetical protein
MLNRGTKLSNDHVAYLYQFCVKHYVRDYDVQIELVDHLTNSIEQLWQTNPNYTFEEALDKCYKSFGYKGFAGIVEQKTKAIQAQHAKAKSSIFWSFFTIPKIALVFMIASIIFLMPQFFLAHQLKIIVSIVLLISVVLHSYFIAKLHKQNKKQQKQLLLTANVYYVSDGPLLLYVLFPYHKVYENISFSVSAFYLLSSMLFVLSLSLYISITYGKTIIAKAKNNYPLAFS